MRREITCQRDPLNSITLTLKGKFVIASSKDERFWKRVKIVNPEVKPGNILYFKKDGRGPLHIVWHVSENKLMR